MTLYPHEWIFAEPLTYMVIAVVAILFAFSQGPVPYVIHSNWGVAYAELNWRLIIGFAVAIIVLMRCAIVCTRKYTQLESERICPHCGRRLE